MGRETTQLRALIVRRLTITKRDKKFACIGLAFPILGTLVVILISRLVHFDSLTIPPTTITDSPQSIPFVAYDAAASQGILTALQANNNNMLPYTSLSSLNSALLNGTKGISTTLQNLSGAYVFEGVDNTTRQYDVGIMYNASVPNSLAVMTQKITRAIYRTIRGQDVSIQETNAPLPSFLNEEAMVFMMYGPLVMQYCSIFILPYFSILLVAEREKKLKHQLLLNSVDLKMYWLSTYLVDFGLYMIPTLVSIILLYACQVKNISDNNFIVTLLVWIGFGTAGLPMSYLLSNFFVKEETANRFLYSAMSIMTIIPYLVLSVGLANQQVPTFVYYLLSALPPYGLQRGVSVLAQASFNGGLGIDDLVRMDGQILPLLLIQFGTAILIWLVLAVWEFKIIQPYIDRIFNIGRQIKRVPKVHEDDDVRAERARVDAAGNSDMIRVCELQKQFEMPPEANTSLPKIAVRGVTFGVGAGECFGLLGPNGAGKTTLLSMLSGDITPDMGESYIDGFSTSRDRSRAFRSIGICPQFDVLWDLMTGREHLRLYARIKMVPEEDVEATVDEFLTRFGLSTWADGLSSTYSGGNKRKLSAAISLIGNPKVVFMDEPSTGMDPVTRRMMWEVINGMKAGRAIILTTHSMDEADALCSRIGIMVKGNLRCVGSSQHLKDRYGSGYKLTISAPEQRRNAIEQWVHQLVPQARAENTFGKMIDYIIPQEAVSLPNVFGALQANKHALGMTDYCVSQTSLEQVFLRFAMEQEEDDTK
eukprot:TRINITY_DN5133_c0_g1_i1.p1 TRINITY_DN5133_c0_g1~~TRINITY_DN5133_c0_g1_i1.p1  ORF type:complete len:762 (-),score=205.47 TRINITY_DN5133_c0_g1_i1:1-2286(-)